jgi:hypothetical protein
MGRRCRRLAATSTSGRAPRRTATSLAACLLTAITGGRRTTACQEGSAWPTQLSPTKNGRSAKASWVVTSHVASTASSRSEGGDSVGLSSCAGGRTCAPSGRFVAAGQQVHDDRIVAGSQAEGGAGAVSRERPALGGFDDGEWGSPAWAPRYRGSAQKVSPSGQSQKTPVSIAQNAPEP